MHGGSTQKRVIIFDTTLRDGQQCPGAGMSFERNIEYARLAAAAKIDVLEAGFPAASAADFEIVKTIAEELSGRENSPVIAALCQLREDQVDRTIESLSFAARHGKGRFHVYLPVDPELMRASLGERAERKNELVRDVARFTARALAEGLEVEFSPEGYSRMGENFDFTTDCIRAAIESGASIINCPDTIGGASKFEGPEYFVEKMKVHAALMAKEFPGRSIIWSTHCHNDFGLALDNSINAVFDGPATQIEGCFNGIGERAGNLSLEQVIMVIRHFGARSQGGIHYSTEVLPEKIQAISDFVHRFMLPRQPNWPITGENASRHSSGGHTNAILKNPLAYQAFDPKELGREITFLFGPLSGGNHAKSIIEHAGYRCDDSEKAAISQFIKDLYRDRRKGITDEELLRGYVEYRKPIDVTSFAYSKSSNRSELKISGRFFGTHGERSSSCEGRDSALATLHKMIEAEIPGIAIEHFSGSSSGSGIHATSVSTIIVTDAEKRTCTGRGEDHDIEISALRALVDATNRLYVEREFRLPSTERGAIAALSPTPTSPTVV